MNNKLANRVGGSIVMIGWVVVISGLVVFYLFPQKMFQEGGILIPSQIEQEQINSLKLTYLVPETTIIRKLTLSIGEEVS